MSVIADTSANTHQPLLKLAFRIKVACFGLVEQSFYVGVRFSLVGVFRVASPLYKQRNGKRLTPHEMFFFFCADTQRLRKSAAHPNNLMEVSGAAL